MIIIFGFIIIALAITLFVIGCIFSEDEDKTPVIFGLASGLAAVFGIALIILSINPRPTAIDVYRGNTTLQITYQDSIPVDSVVVFKNK